MDSGHNKHFFEGWIRYTAITSVLKKVAHSLLKISSLKVAVFDIFHSDHQISFSPGTQAGSHKDSPFIFFQDSFFFQFYTLTKKIMKIFGWQGGSAPSYLLRLYGWGWIWVCVSPVLVDHNVTPDLKNEVNFSSNWAWIQVTILTQPSYFVGNIMEMVAILFFWIVFQLLIVVLGGLSSKS